MNYLVIYPGRFHPFHRGHRASYEYLAKKYGTDHVYIATTGVQAPVTSPFSFADKVRMIATLGIPAGHVVKVSNPYQSREITDSIPAEEKANTVLIFALSAKDAERFNFAPKKDGTPSYLQPMPKNVKQLKPITEHAYVEITPTVNFKVKGKDANSASQIREFYIKGNNNDRDQIIADLYGEAYPELRDIFDDRLGVTEQVQKIVREAKLIKTARSVALLEQILTKERCALKEFAQDKQGVAEDNVDEVFGFQISKPPVKKPATTSLSQMRKEFEKEKNTPLPKIIQNKNADELKSQVRIRRTDEGAPKIFNSKHEVIDYFVKHGKTAAQGAAAWERGWRGSKAKPTAPVKSTQTQQRYWWQDKDDINESADYLDEN